MKRVLLLVVSLLLLIPQVSMAEVLSFDSEGDLAGWTKDRAEVQMPLEVADGNLKITLNPAGVTEGFYGYQGIRKDFRYPLDGYRITGDLYVDSDWESANVGIWGVMYHSRGYEIGDYPNGDRTGYPIISWRKGGGYDAGFYAFDYKVGGWLAVGGDYSENAWHTIQMVYTGLTTDYYIDGLLALSFADDEQEGNFGEIILNSFNYGTQEYQIRWDNVGIEAIPTPEPSTFFLLFAGLVGMVGLNRKRFTRK